MQDMAGELDEAIRERAYELWLADNCRLGSSHAYWLAAQRQILAASIKTAASASGKRRARRDRAA